MSESLAEANHDCDFFEEVRYCLAPAGIMIDVLYKHNIEVTMEEGKEIFEDFMSEMIKLEYITDKENNN